MAPTASGVRVLTLNVAHGRGTRFNQILTRTKHIRRNLDSIAKLIQASDADVVCPMIRNAGSLHMMGMGLADMFRGYLATSDSPSGGPSDGTRTKR